MTRPTLALALMASTGAAETVTWPLGWAVEPASATIEGGETFTFALRYAAY